MIVLKEKKAILKHNEKVDKNGGDAEPKHEESAFQRKTIHAQKNAKTPSSMLKTASEFPPPPFLKRIRKVAMEKQYNEFLDAIAKAHRKNA